MGFSGERAPRGPVLMGDSEPRYLTVRTEGKVAELARELHLTVPAFHAHFKAVTHTSPLIRLHQARLLMIPDGRTAAAAAEVGYASSSQFGREFKRFFGRSPVEKARCMKACKT